MKALIPAAGRGTRMRPFTHTKPKGLIYVAGKPIFGHILDALEGIVDEVVVIVGYMKDQLMEYCEKHHSTKFKFKFIEQVEPRGLGHAVYLGMKDYPDESFLITLGDEFFETEYSLMLKMHKELGQCAGSLGIKQVENPRHYGVVTLDGNRILDLEEKPIQPKSDNAIAGVYFIEDTKMLLESLELACQDENKEVQLTDALQDMVDKGADLRSFPVDEWYDCGRPEMLLDVNKLLLEQNGTNIRCKVFNTIIIEPVVINKDCQIINSIIGPNVSINKGAHIESTIIKNSIVGFEARIESKLLKDTIVGDNAILMGKKERMHVGDSTEIFED